MFRFAGWSRISRLNTLFTPALYIPTLAKLLKAAGKMHGPTSTAGKIDQFETRFTMVGGAHFMIAGNGKEAWPVSAAEAEAFKSLYRRRMIRARWIRRGVILTPLLFIWLNILLSDQPESVRALLGVAAATLFVIGIPLAFLQHALTGDLTRWGIERQLSRRITTRLPEAITPPLTPVGHFGRRLLFACIALELGMIVLHLAMGEGALAEHMRVLYGQTSGNEGPLARFTGNLAWVTQLALMLAIVLMIVDRRIRRRRAEEAKAAEKAETPLTTPR